MVVETDTGGRWTGIEIKTSDALRTQQHGSDQLSCERSFEGQAYWNGRRWTIGDGSGIATTPHGILNIMKANKERN